MKSTPSLLASQPSQHLFLLVCRPLYNYPLLYAPPAPAAHVPRFMLLHMIRLMPFMQCGFVQVLIFCKMPQCLVSSTCPNIHPFTFACCDWSFFLKDISPLQLFIELSTLLSLTATLDGSMTYIPFEFYIYSKTYQSKISLDL